MPFWFNVTTRQVEEDADSSAKEHLLGPYATREEASQALDKAAERTRQWDEEDARER